MKKVVGAIPILAVLVLVFVGLVGTQIASAAVDITPSKPNPVPGDDEGLPVDTNDASFNTVITVTVTGSSTQTGTLPNVIETLTVTIDADESGDVLFLQLTETGIATGIFDGSFKVVDDTSSSTSASSSPAPADGKAADTPTLATEDEDEITIVSGVTSEKIDVENDAPNLGELDPGHEEVVDDGDVDFTIEIDDPDSGIPEPEDLPDARGDEDYMSVVFLKSDVQCTDAELISGVKGLLTGNQPLNKAKIEAIDCDNKTNVLTIIQVTDESDYDEIDDGFEVDFTIVLSEGTSYIGLIAYDNAGNAEIFDADDTDDMVALAQIDIDETEPDFTSIRTGVAYDSSNDEYGDDERDWIQVILKDATDLDPDTIDADDFVVEGHTVIRAVWYDVDPEEIAGGPDSGAATAAGPKDADGKTKAVCSNAGRVVDCDVANASILRPASWIPGQSTSITRPDNNGFFFIRNAIFLQLDDELDPDEEPQVNVVPDGVDDEAGNTIDDGEDDATDLIPPGFTVVSLEGPIAGKPLLAGEDDQVDMVITSDEELSKKPTVTVAKVNAPDGCVVNGVIQTAAQQSGCSNSVRGGALSASVKEIGTNRWEVNIDDPADTGYHNILIQGTDENGVDGTEGLAVTDIATDFFEDDGDVNEEDAVFFEGDTAMSDPHVEVAGEDAANDPDVEFRDPLFVVIDFTETEPGDADNESEEYAEDNYSEVVITLFELDGVDLTDEVITTNDKVFTVPIAGISIGDHEIVIQGEDEAGNELDDDLELDFTVEERDAFELEVNPGWNFKSLPGTAADPMLSAIFEGTSVTTIYTFDPSVPGGWLVAVLDEDMWVGDFDSLEVTRAYWMNATVVEAIEIDIPRIIGGAPGEGATPVLPPVLDMVVGWNMTPIIDVSGDVEFGDFVDADLYFASVNAEVGRIVTYDTITNSWDTIAFTEDPVDRDRNDTDGDDTTAQALDDNDLEFGSGYWTYMTGAGTLAPP